MLCYGHARTVSAPTHESVAILSARNLQRRRRRVVRSAVSILCLSLSVPVPPYTSCLHWLQVPKFPRLCNFLIQVHPRLATITRT
jgi:hypothetical protein